MNRYFTLAAAIMLLTGCDSGSGPATTTKLDAVEVEPGTASDAMIMLDDSDVDGTAVDTSGGALTDEGAAAARAAAEKAAATAPPSESEEEGEATDADSSAKQ